MYRISITRWGESLSQLYIYILLPYIFEIAAEIAALVTCQSKKNKNRKDFFLKAKKPKYVISGENRSSVIC